MFSAISLIINTLCIASTWPQYRTSLSVADISNVPSGKVTFSSFTVYCWVGKGSIWKLKWMLEQTQTPISPILLISSLCPCRSDHGWREQPVKADRKCGEEHRVPETGTPHFTARPPPGDPLPAEAMLRWVSHCCCVCLHGGAKQPLVTPHNKHSWVQDFRSITHSYSFLFTQVTSLLDVIKIQENIWNILLRLLVLSRQAFIIHYQPPEMYHLGLQQTIIC